MALSFLLTIIIAGSLAYAPSLGVIPTDINMGHVSRGEDIIGELYLSTSSDNKLNIRASYINPVANPWFRNHISEYSEEDISGWLSFPKKAVEVDGTKSFTVTVGDVRTRANKKVEFTLHVPKNAEPGYHAGSINIQPISEQEKGPAVTLYALARPNFVFRVNGEVTRRAAITRIEAERLSKNSARIILHLKNTGTNTISFDTTKSHIKIYNSNNEIRAEIPVMSKKLRPGEETPIKIKWQSSEEIKDGRYKVFAVINYRSGETSKSEFVTVPSMIAIAPPQGQLIDANAGPGPVEAILSTSTCATNWTLILSLSLLIGFIVYWRMPHTSLLSILLLSSGLFFGFTLVNYILFCYRNTWSIIIIILSAIAIYYWKKP